MTAALDVRSAWEGGGEGGHLETGRGLGFGGARDCLGFRVLGLGFSFRVVSRSRDEVQSRECDRGLLLRRGQRDREVWGYD